MAKKTASLIQKDSPNYIDPTLEAAQNEEQAIESNAPITGATGGAGAGAPATGTLTPAPIAPAPTHISSNHDNETTAPDTTSDTEPEAEPEPTDTTEPIEVTPTDPSEYLEGAPTLDMPEAPTLGAAPTVTDAPQFGAPEVPTAPEVTTAPTIPGMTVSPAPEYEITPEQQAWQDMYSGQIQENINNPKGISEEAQKLMMRKATLMLQSRETENLRLMANDMERKGITDSGQVFERTQQIKATTTRALAASITDIGLKSEMMKMESYERAMGHAANYLSVLSHTSDMKYGSKMATWNAQTQTDMVKYQAEINVDLEHWKMENQFNMMEWSANKDALFMKWETNANAKIAQWSMTNQFAMEEWKTGAQYDLAIHQIDSQVALAQFQAQTDIYKMGIAQAYQEGNMVLAGQIAIEAREDEQAHEIEIAEMTIEHDKKAASATGFGNFIGTLIGGLFGWLF